MSETDKKPTGPAAAAEEIVVLQQEWFLGDITPEPDEQVSAIEAIILRHCPQDKAGKLAEALQYTLDKYVEQTELPAKYKSILENGGLSIKNNPVVIKAQSALDNHEKEKK